MGKRIGRRWYWAALALGYLAFSGCQMFSDRLTRWAMLGQEALDDPIQAVGGDGVVFAPGGDDAAWDKRRLASATPQDLVAYYAPVFVQQRVNTAAHRHPYPKEY